MKETTTITNNVIDLTAEEQAFLEKVKRFTYLYGRGIIINPENEETDYPFIWNCDDSVTARQYLVDHGAEEV
ncbi:MAG TPA: hypothetical protein VEA37_10185, partial [Flavobacterium sp.]|nr:hypothetical protein [Flavobacterium sp.]